MADIAVENRQRASLPSVTLCPMPGMKKETPGDFANDIKNYCEEDVITAQCMNKSMYVRYVLLLAPIYYYAT